MTLSVGSIIADALAESYPFLAEYGVGKGHLFRHLSAIDADVVRSVAVHTPHALASTASFNIVAASNAGGYTLSYDALKYISFHYVLSDGHVWPTPIRIVREDQLDNAPDHPSAVLRGVKTFLPCDPTGMRWSNGGTGRSFYTGNGDSVSDKYVARPTALTSLTQNIASPDEARNYFVKSLVYQLLLAYPGTPVQRLQDADMARQREFEALHGLLARRSPVQSSFAGTRTSMGASNGNRTDRH